MQMYRPNQSNRIFRRIEYIDTITGETVTGRTEKNEYDWIEDRREVIEESNKYNTIITTIAYGRLHRKPSQGTLF